jgi:hypothetical protein
VSGVLRDPRAYSCGTQTLPAGMEVELMLTVRWCPDLAEASLVQQLADLQKAQAEQNQVLLSEVRSMLSTVLAQKGPSRRPSRV